MPFLKELIANTKAFLHKTCSIQKVEKAWKNIVLLLKIAFALILIIWTCVQVPRVLLTVRKSIVLMPLATVSPDKQLQSLGEAFSQTLEIELNNVAQTFNKNICDIGEFGFLNKDDKGIPTVIGDREAMEEISVEKFSPSLPVSFGRQSLSISTIFEYLTSLFRSEYGKARITGTIEKYDKEVRLSIQKSPSGDGDTPITITRSVNSASDLYDLAREASFNILRTFSNKTMNISSYQMLYERVNGFNDLNKYSVSGNKDDLASAEKHFSKAVSNGEKSAYDCYNLGVIAYEKARKQKHREENIQEAIERFKEALRLDKKLALAHAALLKIYSIEYFRYANRKYLNEVRQYLENKKEVDELIKSEKNKNIRAKLYYALGVACYVTSQPDHGIRDYTEAIPSVPI